MNRHVQCTLPEYNDIIRELSSKEFETLYDLKKIMKECKMAKYYRYLYSIYYDIKGKKAIHMTFGQIDDMANLFVKLKGNLGNSILKRKTS